MLKKYFISFSIVLIFAAGSFAQKTYTPEKGSAQRKAILDALRAPVEKDLRQKIQFAIDDFTVLGGWAFIGGQPQSASGGQPNYRGTKYEEAVNAGAFDNNFFALLRETRGKWRVITFAIGCTDVCYADWWRRHKAPKAIFPYTE